MINIKENLMQFVSIYTQNPFKLITLIIDILIVLFLAYHILKIAKESRAWQLIKGITLLIIATWLSGLLNFRILNYILSAVMNWGVILLIIIFQPEIRRALEQLGTNSLQNFLEWKKISQQKQKKIYIKLQ